MAGTVAEASLPHVGQHVHARGVMFCNWMKRGASLSMGYPRGPDPQKHSNDVLGAGAPRWGVYSGVNCRLQPSTETRRCVGEEKGE